ncbi:MAG: hypothetical protein ABR925_03580 [Acidimicrobiales bacterium]
MSLVIIAVLAVIWLIALTPMILRKLSEHQFSTSVNAFHRQLRGIRRVHPQLPPSALDFEMPPSAAPIADEDQESSMMVSSTPVAGSYGRPTRHPTPQLARRRRVLAVLVATMLGLFLLGIIPGLAVLWDISLLAFGITAAYLALLIHFHRCAVERESKVVDIQDRRTTGNASIPATALVPAGEDDLGESDWTIEESNEPACWYEFDEMTAAGR